MIISNLVMGMIERPRSLREEPLPPNSEWNLPHDIEFNRNGRPDACGPSTLVKQTPPAFQHDNQLSKCDLPDKIPSTSQAIPDEWITSKVIEELSPGPRSSVTSYHPAEILLWKHYFILALLVGFPNALLVVCFSSIFFGHEVYSLVARRTISLYGDFALIGASMALVTCYVFRWQQLPVITRGMSGLLVFALSGVGVVCKSRKYPWAPMLFTICLVPLGIGSMRSTVCKDVSRCSFYGAVWKLTLLFASILVGAWLLWMVASDRVWSQATKDSLIERSAETYRHVYTEPLNYSHHCGISKNLTIIIATERSKVNKACATAATIWFLIYSCPAIGMFSNLVMSLFSLLQSADALDMEDVSRLQRTLRQFVLCFVFMLAGMYGCVQLSGANLNMASVLMAFFAAALAALMIWAYLEIGPSALSVLTQGSVVGEVLVKFWQSDWCHAIIIVAFNVLVPLYFAIDLLRMRLDSCRGIAERGNGHVPDKFKRFRRTFTAEARAVMEALWNWNWASVLSKVNILGEIFFTMQVGVAKFAVVLLSLLDEVLSTLEFGTTVCLCVCTCFSLFLFPPMPATPVYFLIGIVIAKQGTHIKVVGFWGGSAVAVAAGFVVKMTACTAQYLFGRSAGKVVKVQQMVGVDTVPIRAIEWILQQRGLSLAKVAVLVGGPDWPTSVLCGILRLDLCQMLLGTCPVIIVVAPCVLSGSFMSKVEGTEERTMWDTLANIAVGVAILVNTASSLFAVFKGMDVIRERSDELAQYRKEHEAVAALTSKEAAYRLAYAEESRWLNLGCFWQCTILVAASLQLLSGFIFVMLSELCFRPFSMDKRVGDSFDENGLAGNVMNIIRFPVGWGALAMFVVACCLHVLFLWHLDRNAKRCLQRQNSP